MQPLVKIENICQSFRTGFWMQRVQVLDSITFEIPKQSVFGILGANGAGKTTLIHLLVGLRRPASGGVTIGGVDSRTREARANLGYLPERPYFHEHLTGGELLRYMGKLAGMTDAAMEKRIPFTLEKVGMLHARDKELQHYSKGMLQRVGIAQALLHDPELLILDEPMSGLDPRGRKEIRELIRDLAREGKTIFFSTHMVHDVEALCDHLVVVEKGKLIENGPLDQFMNRNTAQTEISVSGVSAERLESLLTGKGQIKKIPEGAMITVKDREEVNTVLGTLIAANANIVKVYPVRSSLEDFF